MQVWSLSWLYVWYPFPHLEASTTRCHESRNLACAQMYPFFCMVLVKRPAGGCTVRPTVASAPMWDYEVQSENHANPQLPEMHCQNNRFIKVDLNKRKMGLLRTSLLISGDVMWQNKSQTLQTQKLQAEDLSDSWAALTSSQLWIRTKQLLEMHLFLYNGMNLSSKVTAMELVSTVTRIPLNVEKASRVRKAIRKTLFVCTLFTHTQCPNDCGEVFSQALMTTIHNWILRVIDNVL